MFALYFIHCNAMTEGLFSVFIIFFVRFNFAVQHLKIGKTLLMNRWVISVEKYLHGSLSVKSFSMVAANCESGTIGCKVKHLSQTLC